MRGRDWRGGVILALIGLIASGCGGGDRGRGGGGSDGGRGMDAGARPDGEAPRPDGSSPPSDAGAGIDARGGGDAGGGRDAGPPLAFCRLGCSASSDCTTSSPAFDADNYSCEGSV